MGLIKKIDVPKHFAARRALRLIAARKVIQHNPTGLSEIHAVGIDPSAAASIDGFSQEPSSANVAVPSKE
jgi:hypothetical protein